MHDGMSSWTKVLCGGFDRLPHYYLLLARCNRCGTAEEEDKIRFSRDSASRRGGVVRESLELPRSTSRVRRNVLVLHRRSDACLVRLINPSP